EYDLALVRRYPGAVVLHLYEERAVLLSQCDVDSPARPTVERGVVEEVVHEETEAAFPPAQRGSVDRVVELVADVRMPPPRGIDRGVDQVAHLHVLAREALRGVAARERLQALEEV